MYSKISSIHEFWLVPEWIQFCLYIFERTSPIFSIFRFSPKRTKRIWRTEEWCLYRYLSQIDSIDEFSRNIHLEDHSELTYHRHSASAYSGIRSEVDDSIMSSWKCIRRSNEGYFYDSFHFWSDAQSTISFESHPARKAFRI